MKKPAALLLLAFIGCAPDPEIARLSGLLDQVRLENVELRRLAPSEQPKVIKELEDMRARLAEEVHENRRLREDLEVAKRELSPELQPISVTIKSLKDRVAALEATASRKGHTHGYKDSEGTFFKQTTDPDQ